MKIFNRLSIIVLSAPFALGFVLPVVAFAAGPAGVNLGTAGNFTILAKTAVTTTGVTSIVGDVGISPAQASYLTGFALTLPAASASSTSAIVTGKIYAPGYANPTPANISTAVSDMQTAYTDAMGRTNPTATELGAGNIGGMTFAPGLYKWGTGVTIPADVTLSGGANDVWIFQIAQNLNVSSATKVVLTGGARASNVYWVVAGQTTIGTTAAFNGNILDQTAIVLNTGATLNGRALAQTAVTLDSNVVLAPAGSPAIPATPAVPATPATPAVPTVSPAIPATPATPAVPATPATQSSVPEDAQAINTLRTRLNQLLITAQDLQIKAGEQTTQQSSAPASAFGQQVKAIVVGLAQGSQDSDVTTLQKFLISQNKGSAARALAKVGATAYFGGMTRAALAEFQASVGISPALGNFGSITRAYLKANY